MFLYEDFTPQDGDFGLMKELEQRHQGILRRQNLRKLIWSLVMCWYNIYYSLSRIYKKIEDAKNKIPNARPNPIVESPRREPRRQMYELEAAPLLRKANEKVNWCKELGRYVGSQRWAFFVIFVENSDSWPISVEHILKRKTAITTISFISFHTIFRLFLVYRPFARFW